MGNERVAKVSLSMAVRIVTAAPLMWILRNFAVIIVSCFIYLLLDSILVAQLSTNSPFLLLLLEFPVLPIKLTHPVRSFQLLLPKVETKITTANDA